VGHTHEGKSAPCLAEMIDIDQWFSVIANQLKRKMPSPACESVKNSTSTCAFMHSLRDFERFTDSAADSFTGWHHLRLTRAENQVVAHWKVNLRDEQWLPLYSPPVVIDTWNSVPLRLVPPMIPDYSSLMLQLKNKKCSDDEWKAFIEEEKMGVELFCSTCMQLRKLQQEVVIRQRDSDEVRKANRELRTAREKNLIAHEFECKNVMLVRNQDPFKRPIIAQPLPAIQPQPKPETLTMPVLRQGISMFRSSTKTVPKALRERPDTIKVFRLFLHFFSGR